MKKRLLTLALALVMVLTLIPAVIVSADDGWTTVTVSPTCSLEGYTCDVHYNESDEIDWAGNYVYTPALGHTWGDAVLENGTWYATCDVCGWKGYLDGDDCVTITVPATCTADGYTIEKYTNGWIGNQKITEPALGHDWGEFDHSQSRVPFPNSACDPVAICNRCGWSGYVYSWTITDVEATCTADGYTEYENSGGWKGWVYDEGSALGHDYNEAVWDGYGWYIVCDRCEWAGYIKVPFTVTFNSDGGSQVEPQIVQSGSLVSKPDDPVKDGFTFIGWYYIYEENNFAFNFDEMIVNWDITLTAVWEAISVKEITVNFEGVEGVTVTYYSADGWITLDGTFDDFCEITNEINSTNGYDAILVSKGGMSYQFSFETLEYGAVYNVPVLPITVTGISSECSLGIAQDDWVYRYAPAIVGASNVFNVFDNGKTYAVKVIREGYHEITIRGDDYYYAGANVWLDIFYNIAVPEDVSNIRIADIGANWVDTTVWYANYLSSDVITLMKNNTAAKLYFDYNGKPYEVDFVLDGTNPFDAMKYTVNFPGVEGVKLEYYVGGWYTVAGIFDDIGSFLVPGSKVTSVRASKGGMTYQFNGVTTGGIFDVPVIPLRVYGVNTDCDIAVVQSNWVYNYTPVAGGVQTLFNVFDNGRDYEVRLQKTGFHVMSAIAGRTVFNGIDELHAYFGGPFYNVTVPEGVTLVRMQSNNWIVNPANAGDVILLLKTDKGAKMSFFYGGKTYNVDFVLDGSNPFNIIVPVNIVIDPTCGNSGYTIHQMNILTGEFWWTDHVDALGHDFGDAVWDGYGWRAICKRCGWEGYISYDPPNNLSYRVEYRDKTTGYRLASDVTRNNKTYGQTYTETPKDIRGYTPDAPAKDVTMVMQGNLIIFYYDRALYPYTIEHYIFGESTPFATITDEAPYLSIIWKSNIDVFTENDYPVLEGYKYSFNTAPWVITTMEWLNVIKVYYVKDDTQVHEVSYTVEYYKDGVLEAGDTVTVTETVWINEVTLNVLPVDVAGDRYFGYKFESTDPAAIPATIDDGEVIRVYYVKNEDDTKDLSYTVEYYKDGVLVLGDTVTVTETVWVNDPDTLNAQVDTTNLKYSGYKFNGTDPAVISATIGDGEVVKVYYVKDNTQTKDLSYTVEYYKDGVLVLGDTVTATKAVWVNDSDILDVDPVNTAGEKYTGYGFHSTDPVLIPATILSGGLIKVYYSLNTPEDTYTPKETTVKGTKRIIGINETTDDFAFIVSKVNAVGEIITTYPDDVKVTGTEITAGNGEAAIDVLITDLEPGENHYTVVEKDDGGNWEYDTHTWNVTIMVDNGAVYMATNPGEPDKSVFINEYISEDEDEDEPEDELGNKPEDKELKIDFIKRVAPRNGYNGDIPNADFTFALYLINENGEESGTIGGPVIVPTTGARDYQGTISLTGYANGSIKLVLKELYEGTSADGTNNGWGYSGSQYSIEIEDGVITKIDNELVFVNTYYYYSYSGYRGTEITMMSEQTTTTEEIITTTEEITTTETTAENTTEEETVVIEEPEEPETLVAEAETEEETTTEPETTTETTTEEYVIEEEIIPTEVPLANISIPDDVPPIIQMLPDRISAHMNTTETETIETTKEEEVIGEKIPLANADIPEDIKVNPATGDGLMAIVLMAILMGAGAVTFIYSKKRIK